MLYYILFHIMVQWLESSLDSLKVLLDILKVNVTTEDKNYKIK